MGVMVVSRLVSTQTPLEWFNLFKVTVYTEYPLHHSDITQIFTTSISTAINCRNWTEKLLMWRSAGSWDQFEPESLKVAPHKTQSCISIYTLSQKFVTQEWNQNIDAYPPHHNIDTNRRVGLGLSSCDTWDRRITLIKLKLAANKPLTVQF